MLNTLAERCTQLLRTQCPVHSLSGGALCVATTFLIWQVHITAIDLSARTLAFAHQRLHAQWPQQTVRRQSPHTLNAADGYLECSSSAHTRHRPPMDPILNALADRSIARVLWSPSLYGRRAASASPSPTSSPSPRRPYPPSSWCFMCFKCFKCFICFKYFKCFKGLPAFKLVL